MITLLEENETLTQIVYNAGRPHTQPPANRPPNRQDRFTNI